MSMEKQLETKLSKTALETDLQNRKKEVNDNEEIVNQLETEIELLKREKEVFKEMAAVILDNYGYIKPTRNWEATPEFIEVLKKKQIIDNERRLINFDSQIKKYKKDIKRIEEKIKFDLVDIKELEEKVNKK